tara:strand:- start:244 stop:861 length:618 start_codon:yes stop_codon:yes gene_type:complete
MKLKKINIIGYSGHSKVVVESALKINIIPFGYYELVENKTNTFNLKYLSSEENCEFNESIFVTIGDNLKRRKIIQSLKQKVDFEFNIIDKSAIISSTSVINNQTYVAPGVIINSNVNIGFGSIINSGSIIEHDCLIGDYTHVAPGTTLCGNVNIGSSCLIGANTTILPNIIIGNNCIIGAGSTVINNIPDNSIVVGNPGKIIKKI